MSLNNLLNQFMGSSNASATGNGASSIGGTLSKLTSNSGLAGGAAAGGIMALLVGNKSARKFAGKAATYGGAAVLGGLAFKAYQNWQQNKHASQPPQASNEQAFIATSADFELTLIKAMIAAAKADGHIDATEQQNIFNAIEQMDLSTEMKATVFDLLRQPISVVDLTRGVDSLEQKSEVYLASCLVIDPDHADEKAHLDRLAIALALPNDLAMQLQWQAQQATQDQAA